MPDPPPAGLSWNVKSSFIDYLARLPSSEVSVAGGASYHPTTGFTFPAEDPSAPEPSPRHVWIDVPLRQLRFVGDVRFLAHRGLLCIALASPWVEMNSPATASLSVHVPGSDASERVTIASMQWSHPDTSHGRPVWHDLAATLTAEGSALFGGMYAAGTPLDPLSITLAPHHC